MRHIEHPTLNRAHISDEYCADQEIYESERDELTAGDWYFSDLDEMELLCAA